MGRLDSRLRTLLSLGTYPCARTHLTLQTFDYNALETLLLVTSLFILLAGMTFQSGVTSSGSGSHTALTALVACVLVGCVTLFLGMLGREVWNSVQFARRQHRARRQSTGPRAINNTTRAARASSLGGAVKSWTENPLKAGAEASAKPESEVQAGTLVRAVSGRSGSGQALLLPATTSTAPGTGPGAPGAATVALSVVETVELRGFSA
jgi:hypothetical protein